MIPFMPEQTIVLIAPIGILIVAISIGWTLRIPEVWFCSSITLGLSILIGWIFAQGVAGSVLSPNFTFLLFGWIGSLVLPFSILATLMVLIWTEKFRQSIRYTITQDGIKIRGGIWKKQEHMIPHHQIGRVVMEQDFLGILFKYGTVIPLSIARWGAETSIRGIGAIGQKDNVGVGIGYAKGREEGSRYPLDCLYGIPDPEIAQQLINQLICRPAMT
jgi:membrane protein YdbS with pleckstrin-like domain